MSSFLYKGVQLSREVEQTQSDPAVLARAMEKLLRPDDRLFALSDQKRIYFAHPQPLYGTEDERRYLAVIRNNIIRSTIIVNPADASEFQIRDMGFYLDVVAKCDALVYARLKGQVLGGVGLEAEFAMNLHKPVYELTEHIGYGDPMFRVFRAPEYLSREETVQLLKDIGFRK